MATNPLEYTVIGCPGKQFLSEIVPALKAIQARDLIQVVDLLFIRKDHEGNVTMLEANELGNEELAALDPIKESLEGLITSEDVVTLSSVVPVDTSAVIVLLEHLWAGNLQDTIENAHGTILVSGMVPAAAQQQIQQELAQEQEQNSSGAEQAFARTASEREV
ncbi:MAG TPA: DUF6325 family protein [Ktedonobacteraceae bacterium]|nr:DUF6325 family protein [Ktedonobacteraceae bacterium]